jgi:hypothetical protein
MDSAPLLHLNRLAPRTTIRTATGEAKTSIASAQLALPTLPSVAARTGHIVPGFTNNLISLGKLCDAGCTTFIDRQNITIRNSSGNHILTGAREPTAPRLWRINIAPPPSPEVHLATPGPHSHAHIIPGDDPEPVRQPLEQPLEAPEPVEHPQEQPLEKDILPQTPIFHHSPPPRPSHPPSAKRTMAHSRAYDLPSVPALIAYLHATTGFLVKSTWLTAVKRGAYTSWPGPTPGLVASYCPDASETHKGHMAQPRQHIRSTRHPPLTTMRHSQSTFELHKLPLRHLFTDDTGRFNPRAKWQPIHHGGPPHCLKCHSCSTLCFQTRQSSYTCLQRHVCPPQRRRGCANNSRHGQ